MHSMINNLGRNQLVMKQDKGLQVEEIYREKVEEKLSKFLIQKASESGNTRVKEWGLKLSGLFKTK